MFQDMGSFKRAKQIKQYSIGYSNSEVFPGKFTTEAPTPLTLQHAEGKKLRQN